VRQRRRGVAGVDELRPVLEQDGPAQRREVVAQSGDGLGHRVAAVLAHEEHPGGLGPAEDVGDLVAAQRRVDGDEREPGERGTGLQQEPFRDVVGPYRDPLARSEPAEQRAGGAFGVGEQLGVGPAAPGVAVRDAFDERDGVGGRHRGPLQQGADGELADAVGPDPRPQ